MNKNRIALATAAVGMLAGASGALALSPAQAATGTGTASQVTATPTATAVSSGDTFRVSGVVSSQGKGVPGVVTVKELVGGTWVALTGASMHTTSTGTYTIRVILGAKGARALRVVANPDGAGIANSRAPFSVTVR